MVLFIDCANNFIMAKTTKFASEVASKNALFLFFCLKMPAACSVLKIFLSIDIYREVLYNYDIAAKMEKYLAYHLKAKRSELCRNVI